MSYASVVVGNCQIRAVEATLKQSKNFTNRFKFEQFAPVHVISIDEINRLHRALNTCELLIVQLVNENYRNVIGLGTETLKSHLTSKAIALSWPSIYW